MHDRITMRDVAQEAGVAVSTVSYAFNGKVVLRDETKDLVLRAAQKLGYAPRPVRRLAARPAASPLIGLLLPGGPGEPSQDYHYLAETLRGATEAAQDFGYLITVLYKKVRNPLFDFVEICHEKKVKGILVSTPRVHDEALETLMNEGFPTVLIQGHPSSLGMPAVGIDNENGAFRATEHLVILGHHRIALLLPGPLEIQFSAERLQGYKRALETYNLPFDETLIRNGELQETMAEEAMGSLLDLPDRPTAVFAGNDTQAIGAMKAARSRALSVPSDLAVIGFDDNTAARQCTPPLTTMHVPDYKIASEAARLLIRKIVRPEVEPETIILPVELVIRESCGVRSEQRQP